VTDRTSVNPVVMDDREQSWFEWGRQDAFHGYPPSKNEGVHVLYQIAYARGYATEERKGQ